jgi:hypothetical protein
MGQFDKKSFSYDEDVKTDDIGIKVSEVLKIISKNKYFEKFYELLKIQEIEDEFINIPGATKLIETINSIDLSFEKFDLESSIQDISFDKLDKFSMTFKNIQDKEICLIIESDEFTAKPIYSAQNDFFSGMFSMEKFANKLISLNYDDLVYKNLDYLKEIFVANKTENKKFRIIRDRDNNYFLRSITSKKYNNYNNNIAVFVGLITLHREMKINKSNFIIRRCEYNESNIRVYFEDLKKQNVVKVGSIKNIIEVSNDEIRRGALKFTSIVSIIYGDGQNDKNAIFIKPKGVKSDILSIRHNIKPETAILCLSSIYNYNQIQADLLNDIKKINTITKPDQIKFLVKRKIDFAKSSELKKSKKNLLSELTKKVNSITELLELMHKIEMLTEDIDAKEYLRYIIYDALVNKK